MSDKTSLGDRMKHNYEDRYRYYLPRRTHCIIRLDGKAFHTYTMGLDKPYSHELMRSMCEAAKTVMAHFGGSAFAYQQSDEVSILITDFRTIKTDAPFDYNIQKLASVAASVMTVAFNHQMHVVHRLKQDQAALFDARVFSIPDRVEVYNYFLWRQRDCVRNSIMGLAQANFSHKQLHGLNTDQVQEKLYQEKKINWADEHPGFKNGNLIFPNKGDSLLAIQAVGAMFSQFQDKFMELIPERED